MNQETPTINPQFSKLTSHKTVKEILDYKVYEASVPLIYESKWSKSEDIQINNPCPKWCKAAEQLQQFHKIIEADFININNDLQDKTDQNKFNKAPTKKIRHGHIFRILLWRSFQRRNSRLIRWRDKISIQLTIPIQHIGHRS
uniref:Uncharacterized protein n=1 Tax=Cacopsylla melanoneura TaxID=428564 RepID=A0A8D8UJY5_9HEMI